MTKITESRGITEDLSSLATRFLQLAENITKRAEGLIDTRAGRQRGSTWFSTVVAWEFTELDCREAAKVAGQIKDELRRIDSVVR